LNNELNDSIKIKRSQPAAAPTVGMRFPVGAAEGCDLFAFRQSMHEQRDQNDDRDGYAKKEQQ
jgi:hypothetical protein